MNENYIQKLFSKRIGGEAFGKDTGEYKFEKIKKAKRTALSQNPDLPILDFGVGEPDDMAFPIVRDELKKQVDVFENRGYSDNGIEEFKDAAALYLKKCFNVKVNSRTQILHGIGSKPVLAILPLAFIDEGDVVLMTTPGYPVFATHTEYLGGKIVNLPLRRENAFLPDLKIIDKETLKKAKVLVLNYPNNPTGAVANESFYKEVIKFAKDNKIIIVHDSAYMGLVYDKKPVAFLSVDGAVDVGVEIFSLSKSFNMTGWRMAIVCGNELIMKAYGNIKDNVDSGQFKAIQHASIKAIENCEITEKIREKYSRRLDKMVQVLKHKGFDATKSPGSFYLYVPAPKGIKGGITFASAEDVSQYLIIEKHISTVPWDDVGAFLRFSATFVARSLDDENKVLDEFEKRLSGVEFVF